MKKSQVTTEFILAMGLIFIIFLIFMLVMFDQNNKNNAINNQVNIKKECTRIGNLISNVYNLKSGTSITTKSDYIINVYNKSYIEIKTSNNITSANQSAQICSFFGESPNYQITKNFTISNVNGTIIIKQNT